MSDPILTALLPDGTRAEWHGGRYIIRPRPGPWDCVEVFDWTEDPTMDEVQRHLARLARDGWPAQEGA